MRSFTDTSLYGSASTPPQPVPDPAAVEAPRPIHRIAQNLGMTVEAFRALPRIERRKLVADFRAKRAEGRIARIQSSLGRIEERKNRRLVRLANPNVPKNPERIQQAIERLDMLKDRRLARLSRVEGNLARFRTVGGQPPSVAPAPLPPAE
jgi:hypothetical protein